MAYHKWIFFIMVEDRFTICFLSWWRETFLFMPELTGTDWLSVGERCPHKPRKGSLSIRLSIGPHHLVLDFDRVRWGKTFGFEIHRAPTLTLRLQVVMSGDLWSGTSPISLISKTLLCKIKTFILLLSLDYSLRGR